MNIGAIFCYLMQCYFDILKIELSTCLQLKNIICIDLFLLKVCEDCNDVYHGDCPVHGPLVPFDEAGTDMPSLVHTSMPIPAQLTVKPSIIPSAGLGVIANATIASGVRMGPYKGRTITSDEMECVEDTSYMWEVRCVQVICCL